MSSIRHETRLSQIRRFLSPSTSWRQFLVWAALVLTLGFTFLRPEASRGLSPFPSLLFWAAHVTSALVLLEVAQNLVSRSQLNRLPTGVQFLLGGAVGALAFAPVAWLLDAWSGVADATDDAAEAGLAALLGEVSGSAPILIITWVSLNAIRMLRLPEFLPPEPRDDSPAFFSKVPDALGRDLISLEAELHYLRVRTTKGDALILHPFGDATGQLAPELGQQVHRSFWIAYEHFERLDRKGQGGLARMSDGSIAKVSRRHVASLKAAI